MRKQPEELRLPLDEDADERLEAELAAETALEAEGAAESPVTTETGAVPTGRATALRLARLHLRAGALALARAELEAFAGRGTLDEEALLDLAEARWRTGDLAGAGEAAAYAVERGRDDLVALVIAAQAAAALDDPEQARRLVDQALLVAGNGLDDVFAGQPRSLIWPSSEPLPVVAQPGSAPASAAEQSPAEDVPAVRGRAGRAGAAPHVSGPTGPAPVPAPVSAPSAGHASAIAADAFAGGRVALDRGDTAAAVIRLGVAIRLDPGFASAVVEAVGALPEDPGLALVAGDALRILGREAEALEAFHVARRHGQAD